MLKKRIRLLFLLFSVVLFVLYALYITKATDNDDDKFLSMVQEDAFYYFWENVNSKYGLIADSSRTDAPSSIAAVGFGLTAVCIAVERNWITTEDAYLRILKTLKYFYKKAPHVKGFYYHFVKMSDGSRAWNSEVSSIDTAIFIAGALTCAEYFKNTEIDDVANKIYERVDWQWMLNGRDVLCMGWKPEKGFLPYYWDHMSELMVLYALAIGSPTYPIPEECWDAWKRPVGTYGTHEFVFCPTGSLFVYQYSHAWIDFRYIRDSHADYWENSVRATLANRQFCMDASKKFKGYGKYSWGLTACVGPFGYKGYGGGPGIPYHDGTIAPSAVAGSVPFAPDICIQTLKNMYKKSSPKIYGKYGFVNGYNQDRDWVAAEFLGIDTGITLLMIENHRTGLIWNYFMRHPAVKKWVNMCMKPKEVIF
ncbi:glucoamylase family protein [Elusimicrobiota bacterium]